MKPQPKFSRVVLGLSHSPLSSSALRLAASFADILQTELLGLFAKDAALLASAELPFVRELRAIEGRWSQLDPAQLIEDVEVAAQQMRRQMAAAARVPQQRLTFEMFEGDIVSALARSVHQGDIVVVSEPQRPLSQFERAMERQAEAALLAHASVLLVPSKPIPQRGPVAAIARRSQEGGIAIAAAIASASKADLLVVDVGDEPIPASKIAELADVGRISIRMTRASQSCIEAGAMPVSDLGWPRERLMVVGRGVLEDTAAASLGLKRAVPIFIIAVDDL